MSNITVTVEIKGLDALTEALKAISTAQQLAPVATECGTWEPGGGQVDVPQEAAPEQTPTATPPQPAPQEPVPAQPAQVPTSAPTYTRDQIAVAASALMDAGKMADLQALLQKYSVASLVELPKEQYGAFATDLRTMGAQI